MPRKVFLSFLGTSDYEPVRYYEDGKEHTEEIPLEVFIQKAILDLLQSEFDSGDAACVFLTPEAKQRNWLDQDSRPGLASQIVERYPFPVGYRDINETSTKEGIDEVFMTIFDFLEEGDEVYLDITHSWRYLPLLGANLLNYAKALKNIEVKKIYYGALERLGKVNKIKDMDMAVRWVPILDLQRFSELQEWAVAARDFARYGQPQKWRELTKDTVNQKLKETQGKDQNAQRLRIINQDLEALDQFIRTNRGKSLLEFNFKRIRESLDNFSTADHSIRPLHPILEVLNTKINPFFGAADRVWLEAVRWCIDHDLVQQGITQLQEGLFTWICRYIASLGFPAGYFDWKNKDAREFVNSLLSFAIQKQSPEATWKGQLAEKADWARQLKQDTLLISLAVITSQLTDLRNDINHGGYTKTASPSTFSQKLRELYADVTRILPQLPSESVSTASGLLNLSNHPSERWSAEQLQAALDAYTRIEDMPFPQVPPDASSGDIDQLAQEYLEKVLARKVGAVHLMGEMTFTFALVQKLQAQGIPCIASTTERQAIDLGDGRKEMQFRFVRFRTYA